LLYESIESEPAAKSRSVGEESLSTTDDLLELLQAQQSDGRIYGVDTSQKIYDGVMNDLVSCDEIDLDSIPKPSKSAAVETLFVVMVLHRTYLDNISLWRRVEKKARAYLKKQGISKSAVKAAISAGLVT